MINRKYLLLLTLPALLLSSCTSSEEPGGDVPPPADEVLEIVEKTIDKDTYRKKALGGILGQIAGFLSGYEFVWASGVPLVGLNFDWYEFLNGPYAGNFSHFHASTPGYDRHQYVDGVWEVWSDDDFHIDFFNQLTMKEYGFTAKDLKDSWKDYRISDWGGGYDAMSLINSHDMLAPYTGTIEAGNRFGWCTEAYIENETLGITAAGMPNAALALTDTFASNTGYFDSLIWGKFFAASYAMAFFENDVKVILNETKKVLPKGSGPRIMFDAAYEAYELYPNAENQTEFRNAAKHVEEKGRLLYRMDNPQTNPGINGGFAVLSWLYGDNDYLKSCKYASMMGYDGDCTAATVTGLIGIINGFNPSLEEYTKLNNLIYQDGRGIYYNDRHTTFPPFISSPNYPDKQTFDQLVDLYVHNFETYLVKQGGRIEGNNYVVPTTAVKSDQSILFNNCDAELRDNTGWFTKSGGELSIIEEGELVNVHSGYASFKFTNDSSSKVLHRYTNLVPGAYYRVSTFTKVSKDSVVELVAIGNGKTQSISIGGDDKLLNKDFIFKATAKTMDVGFSFALGSKADDYVIFDDFQMERISYKSYFLEENNLKSYSNKFIKTLNKPADVAIGDEVYVRVEYASKTSGAVIVGVNRNQTLFGSVVASKTGKSLITGSDYLEIPYIFEKESDFMQLSFDKYSLGIGSVEIIRKDAYMFR